MKLSRHESLVESRLAERCDKLTIVDTLLLAACAKFTVAVNQRADRPTK